MRTERLLTKDVAGYSKVLIPFCMLVVLGLTLMRGIFASVLPLRVDEAYYWTWSRESVISYLDHPPMISWCVYFGTQIFGDSNFGVRFSGLLAMPVMEVLLADIVWQTTRDWRYAILAVLLPESTLNYGLLITKVVPDTALIAFALAMVWSLVRLALSGNPRWWLLAGVFGGFALLSKFIVVLLLPAIVAYAIVPSWRVKQLSSPCPWLAALIALAIFLPVLYWNTIHDWAAFRFQLDRPTQMQEWSPKFLAEFVVNQFVLLGPMLFRLVPAGEDSAPKNPSRSFFRCALPFPWDFSFGAHCIPGLATVGRYSSGRSVLPASRSTSSVGSRMRQIHPW